jgi:hypothetical protein
MNKKVVSHIIFCSFLFLRGVRFIAIAAAFGISSRVLVCARALQIACAGNSNQDFRMLRLLGLIALMLSQCSAFLTSFRPSLNVGGALPYAVYRKLQCSTAAKLLHKTSHTMRAEAGPERERQRLGNGVPHLPMWISTIGGSVSGVCIEQCSPLKGLGLRATRDIAAGQELVTVPRAWCINLTGDDVGSKLHPQLPAFAASLDLQSLAPSLSPRASYGIALGMALLSERTNPESAWDVYLTSLPADYSNMPMFFDAKQAKALHKTLVESIRERCNLLEKLAAGPVAAAPKGLFYDAR